MLTTTQLNGVYTKPLQGSLQKKHTEGDFNLIFLNYEGRIGPKLFFCNILGQDQQNNDVIILPYQCPSTIKQNGVSFGCKCLISCIMLRLFTTRVKKGFIKMIGLHLKPTQHPSCGGHSFSEEEEWPKNYTLEN